RARDAARAAVAALDPAAGGRRGRCRNVARRPCRCGDRRMVSEPNNPSLAAERTALAWQRSGLSLAAVGAVIAKGVPGSAVRDRPLVGAIAVALGLVLMAVAGVFEHRRRRQPVRPIATWVDLATL